MIDRAHSPRYDCMYVFTVFFGRFLTQKLCKNINATMHLLFNFVSRLFIPRIMEWTTREKFISFQFSILSVSSCSIICVFVHVYILIIMCTIHLELQNNIMSFDRSRINNCLPTIQHTTNSFIISIIQYSR